MQEEGRREEPGGLQLLMVMVMPAVAAVVSVIAVVPAVRAAVPAIRVMAAVTGVVARPIPVPVGGGVAGHVIAVARCVVAVAGCVVIVQRGGVVAVVVGVEVPMQGFAEPASVGLRRQSQAAAEGRKPNHS